MNSPGPAASAAPGTAAAPRGPRAADLVAESFAIARSHRLPTILIAVLVAAVCAAVLATTGRAAATEARVVANIDDAGTRTFVLTDPTGDALIDAASVTTLANLAGVEWVLALGPLVDVHNAAIGADATPVPAQIYYGDLPPGIALTQGRAPATGEAVIGPGVTTLGSATPYTGLIGNAIDTASVATFTASGPLTDLNDNILIEGNDDPAQVVREIRVQVARVADVARLRAAAQQAVVADNPSAVNVSDPQQLVALRDVIADELGTSSRHLMALILGIGLVIVAITLTGAVSARRRDFGRRRALGASRSSIVALVVLHAGMAAAVGAAAGAGIGLGLLERTAGTAPTWQFTASVCVLAITSALLAAIPPALLTAFRDPARVLRVP